jgi:hypothetical protein
VFIIVEQYHVKKTAMFLALYAFQLGDEFRSGKILDRKSD